MHNQSLAEPTSSGRRRRRSHKRRGFARNLWRFVWPEQVGFTRKLGTWLAVVALIYLSGHAGALGLAHLQVLRVENQLDYWYKRGAVPSAASLVSAFDAIEQANRLHPDNPYQLTLQARLLEWRGYNNGDVIPQDYRAALALHQRAAALRPLWPDTWAEMAQLKVRLNEFDSVLDGYLNRAHELGPYTPAVHVAIAQANLPRLPSLAAEQRALLQAHVLRGVQDHRTRAQVISLVELYGWQKQACQWLQGESGIHKLCQ